MVRWCLLVTSVASVAVIPMMSVICFYFYDIIVITFFPCLTVVSNFIKFEITIALEKNIITIIS